ncbi:carnosine synthase 1 isoform X2 [Lingula anatina]|uniref:Carnosine synthase 1 isoform X2 n=1 Tax=Lingula anatina TaxID=7574 RepID=A0A1S3JUE4_LINAN|nr:carnosine synthase 1 isoform X2 [Lingula anatina]|eukprot:XP_013413716.1 carnosine synthase 1 isoform X2 [Lingula anatina]
MPEIRMESFCVDQEIETSRFWHDLQQGLSFCNLPETEDRTQNPRPNPTVEEITMVVLGEPLTCLNLCLEGGKQCPGGMLLVPSLTWLQKEPTNERDLQTLRVRKAVTFDSCGRTFLDIFTPPRRVNYFMNLVTGNEKADARSPSNNFLNFERDLECPVGVTEEMVKRLDDRILTRILVADAGVAYPDTLAFPFRPKISYNLGDHDISVVPVRNKEDGKENIRSQLGVFLKRLLKKGIEKVVVKVPGSASPGVSYHSAHDQAGVYSAMCQGLDVLEEGESIIVEAFCETLKLLPVPHLDYEEQAVGMKTQALSCTIRAVVCCTPNGNQLVSDIVCGVGHADKPLDGGNTLPLSLEGFLSQWGFQERSEIEKIRSMIKAKAEVILENWMRYESKLKKEEIGGSLMRTNVLGVNFVLTHQEDGSYDAVAVSISNSRKTIANSQIHEFQNLSKLGSSVRPLVATMVNCSQRFLLQGKHILLIGAGEEFVWEAVREYNVKITLVDGDPNNKADKCVHKFIQCVIGDRNNEDINAEKIVQLVRTHDLAIDGCMTVVDDYVPLTSLVCKALRMIGSTPEAARKSKKKSLSQKSLEQSRVNVPFLPNPSLFAVKTHGISQPEDVTGSSNHIQYPALLKPEFGACSYGVNLVKDEAECMKYLVNTKNSEKMTNDPPFGKNHGSAMHLTEYAQGTKHGVEIVVYRGKLLAAFVSDCGPTRIPQFFETSTCMPSCLNPERQRHLITAALQCISGVGHTDGVFNVEFKMTPTGPKLIEINGRMCAWFYRNWVRTVYETDILFLNFLIVCGIQPNIQPFEPTCQFMAILCSPAAHSKALSRPGIATPEILAEAHERGEIIYYEMEPLKEENTDNECGFCAISVKEKSVSEAKKQLLAVCRKYGVDTQEHPAEYVLSTFVQSPSY